MCLKLQSLTFRLPSLRQSRRPALVNMMEKLDFKKELAELYNPNNRDWEVVDVPAMNFLMVDGKGDPKYGEGLQRRCRGAL
jgi:hypothetical protein